MQVFKLVDEALSGVQSVDEALWMRHCTVWMRHCTEFFPRSSKNTIGNKHQNTVAFNFVPRAVLNTCFGDHNFLFLKAFRLCVNTHYHKEREKKRQGRRERKREGGRRAEGRRRKQKWWKSAKKEREGVE